MWVGLIVMMHIHKHICDVPIQTYTSFCICIRVHIPLIVPNSSDNGDSKYAGPANRKIILQVQLGLK